MDQEIVETNTTKPVRFLVDAPAQQTARRIVKKYRNQRIKISPTGGSLIGNKAGNIAKRVTKLGAKTLFKRSVNVATRKLSLKLEKKLIDEGIKHAPNLYRFGTSKSKNENAKKVLDLDIPNCIVEETQKKAKKI